MLSITLHFYHKSSKRQGNRKLWHILFTILCTFIYYSLKTTFHQPLLHKAVYSLCLLQEYPFPTLPAPPRISNCLLPPLPSPPRLHSASSADNTSKISHDKFMAIKQYLYKHLNTSLIRQYHIKVLKCQIDLSWWLFFF